LPSWYRSCLQSTHGYVFIQVSSLPLQQEPPQKNSRRHSRVCYPSAKKSFLIWGVPILKGSWDVHQVAGVFPCHPRFICGAVVDSQLFSPKTRKKPKKPPSSPARGGFRTAKSVDSAAQPPKVLHPPRRYIGTATREPDSAGLRYWEEIQT